MITVANIANATQGELLCITYELLLKSIREMKNHPEYGCKHQRHALDILTCLVSNLNFEYEIARQLFEIYIYIQGVLIKGRIDKEFERLEPLIIKLQEAYKQAMIQQQDERIVMENAETIYAGLTYGKGQINEVVLGGERGFKV